jgi:Fe2+ or Zn2+ uptake regulation protein
VAKYVTKQRRALISYLENNKDRLLSAQEMADALEPQGISKSAIYRNLAELENEGRIAKHKLDGQREVYYRFTDAAECKNHVHLSCKGCGRTYHASGSGTAALVEALSRTEHFTIDKGDTVLYGLCENCSNKR